MSGYRGHLFLGLLVLALLVYCFQELGVWVFKDFSVSGNLQMIAWFLPVALFYSVLPDVDIRTSKVNHFLTGLLFIGGLVSLVVYYFVNEVLFFLVGLFSLFVGFLGLFMKHRGFWHSFPGGLFVSVPLWLVSPFYFLVALCCYWFHLVVDYVG